MDLDHARRRIQEAADVSPLSDIMLELLALVGTLDNDLAILRQRVTDVERMNDRLEEVINEGHSKV